MTGFVGRVLRGGEPDREVLEGAERATLMVVDDPLRQYSSFFLRLLAATVIATAGVAADSSTTIIGAMLVAPLMSPMLGVALAAVRGRWRAVARCACLCLLGTALVVACSAALTALIPVAVDMSTNSQVLARTSPRLVDLVIALAAGFMASLASMRRDIPDAVPGVAISASIVPPLCITGAGLYEGAPGAAMGSLLLFVSNFVAIQVMGSLVYLLMGLGARERTPEGRRVRTAWYAAVAVCAVAVCALLIGASAGVLREAERERRVQDVTSTWLAAFDGDWRVTGLEAEGDDLYVQVAGSGEAPDARALARRLRDEGVDFDEVALSVVEEHRSSAPAKDPGPPAG